MSEVIVGILGFLCIIAIVVTLFKSKTLPSIAFVVFPWQHRAHRRPVRVLGAVFRHHDRRGHV